MLNKLLLCLGSNRNKLVNIELASRKLSSHIEQILFSEIIESDPVGRDPGVENYLNRLAIAYTSKSLAEVISLCKNLEKELGRTPEDKISKSVPIDIDILKWNKQILKEEELKREYVVKGLHTLPLF
ncbi:MAG: 2-amino-4-hydroxy-6-hydroxymethyldihydropteridine diphosphokinase [Tannerellaceae bacterium]|nr:2-amino-4-hydroxy-6-hydroxymethyldihydropteridine diphosphokinase [Tannerellaceae bacterium]